MKHMQLNGIMSIVAIIQTLWTAVLCTVWMKGWVNSLWTSFYIIIIYVTTDHILFSKSKQFQKAIQLGKFNTVLNLQIVPTYN